MAGTMTWVGLDVHARSMDAAVIDSMAARCAPESRRRSSKPSGFPRGMPSTTCGRSTSPATPNTASTPTARTSTSV